MQQVGAGTEPLTVYEKVTKKIDQLKTLKSSYYNFQPECARYKLAYSHLVNSKFPSIKREKISLLEARVSHFCTRANLPATRRKRFSLILRELLNMNYFRYSEGISSFIGDILRDNTINK